MATLLSLNVGKPKDVSWSGRTVHTGIWKAPVEGPRMVRRLNIDGDGQGDLQGHGGEMRAVLVYQADSYAYWRRHFGRDDLEFGHFGENFTVDGLSDDEVCIGDRYRIGDAEFEVTQPRVTCYRVGMRLGEPSMPSLLVSHHRPGFYLRVITEGEVRAGDEITRVRTGPGALSVAAIDALLYLPDRDPEMIRTALTIEALSPGWQQSFRELAETAGAPGAAAPKPGQEPSGWPGFRRLRVTRIVPESSTVDSIYFVPADGGPLPPARAGQYLTVRVSDAPAPPPVRSYSLSSAPGAESYRISVKREVHGLVSNYLHTRLRPGALLEAAAPRGDFVLDTASERTVVLVSAGIGATPVLAMLHHLAAAKSIRPVWWLHTTRSPDQHAFADEVRELLAALPDAHEHVFYTAPADPRRAPVPSATYGRLTADALAGLGLPADADAYLCGPDAFMTDLRTAFGDLGVPGERVHSELFGTLASINPGVSGASTAAPHQPPGKPAPARWSPSPAAACPPRGHRGTARCSNWPKPATCPPAGRAATASATPAPPRCCPGRRATPRNRSNPRRPVIC